MSRGHVVTDPPVSLHTVEQAKIVERDEPPDGRLEQDQRKRDLLHGLARHGVLPIGAMLSANDQAISCQHVARNASISPP